MSEAENFIPGLPTETWNEVFLYLDLRVLKEKCALINWHLREIAERLISDKHEADEHPLERLEIGQHGTMQRAAVINHHGDELPIPQHEVTPNITGFSCIDVSFMDTQVLQFFRSIRSLLAKGVRLTLEQPSSEHLERQELRVLFGWMNLISLTLSGDFFDRFKAAYPQLIAHLPFLRIKNGIKEELIPKLAEWLDRERAEGKVVTVERKLEMQDWRHRGHQLNIMLDRQLRERFLASTTPSEPFCHSYFTFLPEWEFEINNPQTGEILRQTAVEQIDVPDYYRMELRRFPAAGNGQQQPVAGPKSFQSVVLHINAFG